MTDNPNLDHINNSTNVRFKVPTVVHHTFSVLSRIAPDLTGRIAAELFTRPHGVGGRRAIERRWLAAATPYRLEVRGHELAAWSWGDGPTVLLHHGWAGRGSQLGAFVAPLVRAGFSVITYDAPAHGDSSGRTTNGFEMGKVIVDVTRRVFGLHGIIAHSLGSSAAAFAMRSQIPVSRLVFINPPAEMDSYAEVFGDCLGFTDRVIHNMKSRFEKENNARWDDFHPTRLVRSIKIPLLVISDTHDRQAPWEHGKSIADACSSARFIRTDGLGHSKILQDGQVIDQVVGFLSETIRDRLPVQSCLEKQTIEA